MSFSSCSTLTCVTDTICISLRKRLDRQAALPSSSATPAARSPNQSPQASAVDSSSLPPLDAAELQSQLEDPEPTSQVAQTLPDVRELDENLDTAFQLAMNRGPLCAEPVIGMAYFLESVDLNVGDMTAPQGAFASLLAFEAIEADPSRRQFGPSGRTRAVTSSRPDRTFSGTACSTGRLDFSSRCTLATSRRLVPPSPRRLAFASLTRSSAQVKSSVRCMESFRSGEAGSFRRG